MEGDATDGLIILQHGDGEVMRRRLIGVTFPGPRPHHVPFTPLWWSGHVVRSQGARCRTDGGAGANQTFTVAKVEPRLLQRDVNEQSFST